MIGQQKVLVVDDEPDKLALIAVARRMEGYVFHTATDGLARLSGI